MLEAVEDIVYLNLRVGVKDITSVVIDLRMGWSRHLENGIPVFSVGALR